MSAASHRYPNVSRTVVPIAARNRRDEYSEVITQQILSVKGKRGITSELDYTGQHCLPHCRIAELPHCRIAATKLTHSSTAGQECHSCKATKK